MGLDELRVSVTAEGDLDLRGTLGTPDVPVGFQAIRLRFALAGAVPEDRLERLKERTERYCVVLQTLLAPPAVEAEWAVGVIGARRSMTKGPAEPVPSSFGQVQIVAPSSCLAAFQLHRRCAGEDCISVAGVISPEAAAVLALARALPARVRSPSR
jgi:hypothetical protein